ncbi:DoxX family protein [Arcobacter sp. YIC-310]|uniref:DoxX family protein n=1 Tax=Arcobacter sp. YIC-310 TaxID=3376632 RepID=UPI003C224E2F
MKKILYICSRFILGVLLVVAGVAHFMNPEFYLKAMPDYIPFHEFIVYASGVIEILLGILLVISKTSRQAAFAIIALFVAVFPANVNMYLNHEEFADMSETSLLIRLPIQLVLIAWAYIYTRKNYEV